MYSNFMFLDHTHTHTRTHTHTHTHRHTHTHIMFKISYYFIPAIFNSAAINFVFNINFQMFLIYLTDPSLRFGMVDAFKCLEKETKTTKTLYKENLDCVQVLKSVHEPIRVREKSLTARFVTDADADMHTERIYGCLSIFYHCFDFHGH